MEMLFDPWLLNHRLLFLFSAVYTYKNMLFSSGNYSVYQPERLASVKGKSININLESNDGCFVFMKAWPKSGLITFQIYAMTTNPTKEVSHETR